MFFYEACLFATSVLLGHRVRIVVASGLSGRHHWSNAGPSDPAVSAVDGESSVVNESNLLHHVLIQHRSSSGVTERTAMRHKVPQETIPACSNQTVTPLWCLTLLALNSLVQ